MNNEFFTGIDIGSEKIKFFTLSKTQNKTSKVSENSFGVLNGYIQNKNKTSESLKKAVVKAENNIATPITKALFGINSIGLNSRILQTTKVLSKKPIEITEKLLADLKKEVAGKEITSPFISILFIPIEYDLDGYKSYLNPINSIASKISIKYLQVIAPANHIKMIENVAEISDIEIIDIFPTALASSNFILKESERDSGILYIDFGHSVTSYVFVKNGQPYKIRTLPFGSDGISKEIAIKLKISKKDAEDSKKRPPLDSTKRNTIGKIITQYIKNIYAEINKDIEKVNSDSTFFTSGIVLSGAGSRIKDIESIFSKHFKMPVRKITDPNIEATDTSYTGAISLAMENKNHYHNENTHNKKVFSIIEKIKSFF